MYKTKFLFSLLTSYLIIFSGNVSAQCTGGTSAGTLTMTTAWQTAANVNGGTYYNFNAVAGNVYYFSFCAANGGGSSTFDTEITILNNFGNVIPDNYSDDICGATGIQSYLIWTCTNAGTYRVLVNKKPCAAQTNLGTLAYRTLTPVLCPAGLGTGVTNVSSLPYSSGAGTTAGGVNDLTSANPDLCGTMSFYEAEDLVYVFTPASAGIVTVTLSTAANRVGLTLLKGCPLTGNNSVCLGVSQGNGNRTVSACVQQGVSYYVIIDSRSNTPNFSFSNLTISAPVNASGCNVGATVPVTSLPYTSNGRTTCGKGNDVIASNTLVCGNNTYLSNEDEVFVFTPSTSGNITVNITSTGTYTGLFLYEGCPLSSYCAFAGNSCVGNVTSATGTKNLCASVIAGRTYYLVVDGWNTCNPYNINISAPVLNFPGATCNNAVAITLPYSALRENTACLGDHYNNYTTGSCGTLYESGEDKVYSYTAASAECISITLNGASTNNIGYQVYSGCPGTVGATCIASGGGAAGGVLTGTITLPAAGLYYIVVDTWAEPMNAIYDLSITAFGNGITNDLPCNAVPVVLGTVMNGANNCSGGSGEPSNSSCWGTGNALNTVWYSFIAPSSGRAIIRTTAGSLRNTQIAAYSGVCGNAMMQIGCNQNANSCGTTPNQLSQLTLNSLTPGTTYYVVVDGEGILTGTFGILIQDGAVPLPPAIGQDCSQPMPVCSNMLSVGNPGFQSFGNYCDFNGSGICLLSGERGSSWYEIKIAANGTLEFSLVPNDWPGAPSTTSTDYDFSLWKIAGSGAVNCSQIATDAIPVRCNYSSLGVTGLFGAVNATAPAIYPGFGAAYQSGLAVTAGEIYLLVISNFSNSVSGFTLNISPASPVEYGSGGEVAWTGGIDSDWFKTGNWGGCAIPDCFTDAVILPSATNQPIISTAGAAVKTITVAPGASLTIQNTRNLDVCGDFNINGTLNAVTGSFVTMTGSNNQLITGTVTGTNAFAHLTVTKSGGNVTLRNNIDCKGSFTITGADTFNANGMWMKVAGNFSNATGTFNPGTGTVEFNGTLAQTYLSSSLLNNVLMNHTGSGLSLLTDMTLGISGVLTLTKGLIITGALEVNVTNNASAAVSTGNATSYVQGFLRRSVPSALLGRIYDFPVGNALGYQRMNMNFYNGVDPLLSSLRVHFTSFSTLPFSPATDAICGGTYGNSALNNGYWTMTPSGSGQSTAHVTLFNTTYTNAGSLFTVMISKDAAVWNIPAIASGGCNTSEVGAVIRNGISQSADPADPVLFANAQGTVSLPVSLLGFSVNPQSQEMLIGWTTSSEFNNRGFEVQRATRNDNWRAIGWVNGNGTTNSIHNYTLKDVNVATNVMYFYRLRQLDFDGRETFSKVVAGALKDDGAVVYEVYPNPFRDITGIHYLISRPTVVSIEISDVSGRLIKKINQGLQDPGKYTIPFSATGDGTGAGLYLVSLWCDDQPYKFNISAIR
jgi:hypothetical protein